MKKKKTAKSENILLIVKKIISGYNGECSQ